MPRKKPFSGKQKKLQLQSKRQEKFSQGSHDGHTSTAPPPFGTHIVDVESRASTKQPIREQRHLPPNPGGRPVKLKSTSSNKNDRDRYQLLLHDESRDGIDERKKRAMQPYKRRSPEEMESGVELFYDPPIMFPVRPPWDHILSRAQLENQEWTYFQRYSESFLKDHVLGYVELNLETWRQLWRVLEMSDIILHIVDVRFSALHFNPALYDYVTKVVKKKLIVVLNKCDIIPAEVVVAWKYYLLEQFPGLEVVIFTSFPKNEETRDALLRGKQSRRCRKKAAAVGPLELWNVCNGLVRHDLDIDSWKTKILEDMNVHADDSTGSDQSDCEVEASVNVAKADLSYMEHREYRDDILTIGCVGYPNVGKSSVINGLMGHKVVSVSRTPGHTKHFQTIFLTSNVRLCDCPGLVFPSTAPRAVQVLAGMYPVARVREPYSVVQYLAERCNLPAILNLRLPADESLWTAYLICDELAELKGFKTARGARNDTYRAANWILRATLQGQVLQYLLPPDYVSRQGMWREHSDTQPLRDIQMERIAAAEGQRSLDVKSQPDTDSSSSDTEQLPISSRNAFSLLEEC